jgi:hypothetical protein
MSTTAAANRDSRRMSILSVEEQCTQTAVRCPLSFVEQLALRSVGSSVGHSPVRRFIDVFAAVDIAVVRRHAPPLQASAKSLCRRGDAWRKG